ncbi:hypothetical protein [Komagataeibacter swingsii]|uniref:Uncharacterized protein n=1 Tax=Komagataeibacter swingsii TaxID=215220 RepID=A0A850P0G9_9PROT|nr:hypothetical protein [Komagataeibacter swingsii]NVN37014.1 hypothetical protein [Komagataeibacter swingsii]
MRYLRRRFVPSGTQRQDKQAGPDCALTQPRPPPALPCLIGTGKGDIEAFFQRSDFFIANDIRFHYKQNTHGAIRQFSQPSISQHTAVKTPAASRHGDAALLFFMREPCQS